MMKILLNNERKILLNSMRTQRRGHIFGYLLACIVLAVFLYFISKGVWSLSDELTDSILSGILSLGLLASIGFIVLLGVPQVFKDMYSTKDLELLFTLPIKTRHVFWVKYMKSFFGTPLLVYLFLGIPLLIYGISAKVHFIFYPTVLIVLFSTVLIGLSIAYLLNLVLIQIVPASRANEFITVMSVLSGLIVYFIFMFPNIVNDEPITETILSGVSLLPNWVPTSWASNSIIAASHGSISFLLPAFILLLLAVISMVLAMTLVEKGFRTGWIRLNEGNKPKKKKRKKKGEINLSHPITAIGKKEWYAIKRDIREWLVLLPIAMFLIFGLIGFFSGGGDLTSMRGYHQISWPIAQGVFLFVYTFSMGTIASASIGREGASLWILRTLPLSGKQIATGKLWISWLIPFVIITIMEIGIGIALGWTILQFIIGILMKSMVAFGFSSIGLLLGTLGAKYHPTNPQQRLTFGISLLLLVSSWIYMVIVSIPFAYILFPINEIELPPDLEHGMSGFIGVLATILLTFLTWKASFPILMTIVGILLLAAVTFGFAVLCIYLSGRRIDAGIKIDMVSERSNKRLLGKKKSGRSLY